MNILESAVALPVLKVLQSPAESSSAGESFNSLLFPAITTGNSDAVKLLHDVEVAADGGKNAPMFVADVNHDKHVTVEQHLRSGAVSGELKELYEQKLMANYSLSYIDIDNAIKPDTCVNVSIAPQLLTSAKGHNETLLVNGLRASLKVHQESLPIGSVIMSKQSTLNEGAAMSASIMSKLHLHNDSIEKSKIVVGRQGDERSLYVRDHFSDQQTLATVVADILSKFKSKISEVIINGKRG